MDTLNRHQRRAKSRALTQAGYSTLSNGISHETLTGPAHKLLREILTSNGNVISDAHNEALYSLCGLFTLSAQGKFPGRWAFPLACGLGKTSATVAWCSALISLGVEHIGVSVSAATIEALCDLKRQLMKHGVPENRIGLVYTAKSGTYSEPSTAQEEWQQRQIILVSHAMVRTEDKEALAGFTTYRGKPRDLMVYDESLVASEAFGIGLVELERSVRWLGVAADEDLMTFLDATVVKLKAAKQHSESHDYKAQEVTINQAPSEDIETWRGMLPRHAAVAPIRTLFDLAHHNLSAVSCRGGGAIKYTVRFPECIKNLIVLDASYPIRDLCRAGDIKNAEPHLLNGKLGSIRISTPLVALKDYSRVSIRHLKVAGSRSAFEAEYDKKRVDNRMVNAVADTIKAHVPTDKAALVFVFKDHSTAKGKPDGNVEKTLKALKAAGVDIDATVKAVEDGKEVDRPRINVTTWGRETTTNAWSHCSHVFLCGVLQRSSLDLAGTYIGQRNDPEAEVSNDLVNQLVNSEVCHCIYQALSRGSMRVMDNGAATEMTGWIIHEDKTDRHTIKGTLSKVLPKANWGDWESDHHDDEKRNGVTSETAEKIVGYLAGLPQETDRKSVRAFKAEAGLTEVHPNTFTNALEIALEKASWRREDRTLVRRTAEDYGFQRDAD